MKKLSFIAVILSISVGMSAEGKVSVSILGAPASGKGFYYNKLKDGGDFDDIKTAKILTVDILRDDFLEAPFNIKLYEMIKTKDFVASLVADGGREFAQWVSDYDNTMREVGEIIYRATDRHINLFNVGDRLAFQKDGKDASVYQVLSYFDNDNNARLTLDTEIFGAENAYKNLKKVVRGLQYAALRSATVTANNVLFDETGDDLPKLSHRLELLKQAGYRNLVIMIHPRSILFNYMQNASRMIEGGDGGRDSSSSIGESYKGIDSFCGDFCEKKGGMSVSYPKISEKATLVELNDQVTAEEAMAQALTQIKSLRASGKFLEGVKGKPRELIDYLLWLAPADMEGTVKRIITQNLKKDEFQRKVWESLLKLHTDNQRKSETGVIKGFLPPVAAQGQGAKEWKYAQEVYTNIMNLSTQEAFDTLLTAQKMYRQDRGGNNKLYLGITDEVIKEARTVWKIQ